MLYLAFKSLLTISLRTILFLTVFTKVFMSESSMSLSFLYQWTDGSGSPEDFIQLIRMTISFNSNLNISCNNLGAEFYWTKFNQSEEWGAGSEGQFSSDLSLKLQSGKAWSYCIDHWCFSSLCSCIFSRQSAGLTSRDETVQS